MQRLQVILDEMELWEREIFKKEYADVNWYKNKQAKHVNNVELARKRKKLGTRSTSSSSCYANKVRIRINTYRICMWVVYTHIYPYLVFIVFNMRAWF